MATELPRRDQDERLDEREPDLDERLVDLDARDFDELDLAFEALLREPEPLDFEELPEPLRALDPPDFAELPRDEVEPLREREPLDFAELRVPAVFPRADPDFELLELPEDFELRDELFAFGFADVLEDLPPARWDLL